MNLKKNNFIICSHPKKPGKYELCLVQEDSFTDESEVNVISFKKLKSEFKFVTDAEGIRNKDQILITKAAFTMVTIDETEDAEEDCYVNYRYSEAHFLKKLSSAKEHLEEDSDSEDESGNLIGKRKSIKILGKKSDIEISKKIKMSKSGKSKITSKFLILRIKKKESKKAKKRKIQKRKTKSIDYNISRWKYPNG